MILSTRIRSSGASLIASCRRDLLSNFRTIHDVTLALDSVLDTDKDSEIRKLKLELQRAKKEKEAGDLALRLELEKLKKDNEIKGIAIELAKLDKEKKLSVAPQPPIIRFPKSDDPRYMPPRTSKPLRILFCGSDEISSASLRALHREHRKDPELIESIDVLCRPAKRSGRSLVNFRELPIKAVAEELGLTVHERDTFTGWELPKPDGEPINLIIAVSFGLFVPPRILEAAEYGGLNVHPSQLPQYRGPSPLQYTIIDFCKYAGITLQTLDPNSFDHGRILRQQSMAIPDHENITYEQLVKFIAPKAAGLLVQGLRDRLFVPPLVTRLSPHILPKTIIRAPKITTEDKKIRFNSPEVAWQAPARERALGRLWASFLVAPGKEQRFIFEGIERVSRPDLLLNVRKAAEEASADTTLSKMFAQARIPTKGDPIDIRLRAKGVHFAVPAKPLAVDPLQERNLTPVFYIADNDGDKTSVIFAVKHGAIRVRRITVEGQEVMNAKRAMQRFRPTWIWRLHLEEHPDDPTKSTWRVEPAGPDDKKNWLEHKARVAYESSDEHIFAAAGF